MLKILLKALVLNQVIALSLLLAVTISVSLSKRKSFYLTLSVLCTNKKK